MPDTSNLRFYNQFAETYESVYARVDEFASVDRWLRLLEGLELVPSPAMRSLCQPALVDVGCGPGWHLVAWSRQGFQTTGLDGSPAMISLARQNLLAAGLLSESSLMLADIFAASLLSTVAGRFLIAVSHLFFPNLFSPADLGELVIAIASLLRPGGIWIADWRAGMSDIASSRENFNVGGTLWERGNFYESATDSFVQSWSSNGVLMEERLWHHRFPAIQSAASLAGLRVLVDIQFPDTPQSRTIVLQADPVSELITYR